MPATLSAENRIKSHLEKLGCTSAFLANLAQIPASRLSEAFRGIRPLSNSDGILLDGILKRIDELVEAFRPVPVALENPRVIGELLEDLRDRRLTEAYCVRYGRNFFAGRINGQVRSTFSLLQSCPMIHLVAAQVQEALRPSWQDDVEIIKNPYASPDGIFSDFADVWDVKPEPNSLKHPFGPVQARV
jgi:hypothetical protein